MEEHKRYPIKWDELKLYITLAGSDLSIRECEGVDAIIEVEDKGKVDIKFEANELSIKERAGNVGELVLNLPIGKRYSGKCATASGDIELKNILYSGTISSSSGDIKAKGLEGNIEIHSTSGDVDVEDVKLAGLSGSTVSGDFILSGRLALEDDAIIKTVSGDIELELQSSERLAIYSELMSGEVEMEGPYTLEWAESMRNYKTLTLKSVSGSINVKLSEDCKDVYIESRKLAKAFGIGIASKIFDKAIHKTVHKVVDEILNKVVPRMPRGVEITGSKVSSKQEGISQILKMLEQGDVTAEEARKLIDSL